MGNKKIIYQEVQRPGQTWIWVFVLSFAGFSWYSLIQQIFLGNPIGTKPAPNGMLIVFWFIFGVVFPGVLIWFLKLKIEVREDGVYIRYFPFHLRYRKFLYKEIENIEPIIYRARDFGGWGIRFNEKGETAYSMNGKEAIRLQLKRETIVISTMNQRELIGAIQSVQTRK